MRCAEVLAPRWNSMRRGDAAEGTIEVEIHDSGGGGPGLVTAESGGEIAADSVGRAVSAGKPTDDRRARTRARLLPRRARDRARRLPRRRARPPAAARARERAWQRQRLGRLEKGRWVEKKRLNAI